MGVNNMSQVMTNKATNPYEQLVGGLTQQTRVSKEDQEMVRWLNNNNPDDQNIADLFVAKYENDPKKIQDAERKLAILSKKHASSAKIYDAIAMASVVPVIGSPFLTVLTMIGKTKFFLNHPILTAASFFGGALGITVSSEMSRCHENKANEYKQA